MKFYVNAFESLAVLDTSASIFSEESELITANADAVLYVTKEQLRAIFKFQTDADDITNELDDPSGNGFENMDIKFYTDSSGFAALLPSINPANAVVTGATAVSNTSIGGVAHPEHKRMVAHDFVRHIANDLFTTPFAVDLFDNEIELLNSVREVCGVGSNGAGSKYVLEKISDTIDSVSMTDASIAGYEEDANGVRYMPNIEVLQGTGADAKQMNVGRLLFNQMVKDITRITSWIDTANTENTASRNGIMSMPFADGDEIIFKLTLQAAPDQHKLVRNNATPVADRSYKIIWRVSDTPNVAVDVSEL
jgi:hypothetical protein